MSRSTKRCAHRCSFTAKSALIGRKASEVFAAPLGERFEAQDLKVIAEGLSIRAKMERHLYPDGSEGWCLTWKEPLIDASGIIRGLAGISRDAPALSGSAPVSAALSATLAYIDDHLDEPLRIPDLAARAGLSPFQFDQRIRTIFGFSAGQYLSRLRIDRACDRLRHSDASLSELALECGYADQAAFTRQFHKTVGLAPGAYRLATARGRKRPLVGLPSDKGWGRRLASESRRMDRPRFHIALRTKIPFNVYAINKLPEGRDISNSHTGERTGREA